MRVLIILSLLYHIVFSQKECSSFIEEQDCNTNSNGACHWYPSLDECRCISTVKLDILFAVDTSGSIGWEGFQIQKQFITQLVNQGLNNGSRIGFYMFSTEVNTSEDIRFWDTQELDDYTRGIYWLRGWTNTGEVLTDAAAQFSSSKLPDRQQVMIMITDGNPCLPKNLGGCPHSICAAAPGIKMQGIRVIIIGVGSGLNTEYVDCLCSKPEDYIPVASFSTEDFNSIMGSLSGVLCPVSKNCKVTEVKAMRRPPEWNQNGDGRFTRFIEIYNTGIDFNLQQLKLEGLVIMDEGPDVEVLQGQYIVFYDAADLPASTDSSTGAGPSIPTCHDCGSDCIRDAGNPGCPINVMGQGLGTTGYCFCSNSIYIACGNVYNSPDNTCPTTGATTDQSNPTLPATDSCSKCVFDNRMDKTDWYIEVRDSSPNYDLIDEVRYGDQGWWITTDDKHSYELTSKAFDNDIGDHWSQSCSKFGTPGANPYASCDTGCIANGCGNGTNNYCQTNGNCYCDPNKGYYGQCTQRKTVAGIICSKCLQVPKVGDCDVYWTLNGTQRAANFNWTAIEFSGTTTNKVYYKVTYYDSDSNNAESPRVNERFYAVKDSGYDAKNTSYGGYVQACIDNAIPLDPANGGGTLDIPACGQLTMCDVYTARPTQAPTNSPTPDPTPIPTPMPTGSPTWACPRYWWTGGVSQEICAVVNGASAQEYQGGDRCSCHESTRDQCCLLEPDFSTTYDPERKHKTVFGCKLDVELSKNGYKWRDDEEKAGNSPGYLLTASAKGETHSFVVDIAPENYPCQMNIYWRLTFDCMDSNYDAGRRRLQDCSAVNSLADAGLAVDVTEGWLKVWGQKDVLNTTVEFTVTQAECSNSNAGGNNNDPTTTTTRRRLGANCELFNSIAIYGDLEIVNATSECQPNCPDYRLYPMRIPVWYNYGAAFIAPPGTERELPAWLWWLVAALVIFLALLAFLLYRYWWKNKKTGAALGSVQADLDEAVMEQEMGFGAGLGGNAVGFNPLATGFNPNAPAGGVGPNAPPGNDGGQGQFIKPNVERPVFKQVYGQKMGAQSGLR